MSDVQYLVKNSQRSGGKQQADEGEELQPRRTKVSRPSGSIYLTAGQGREGYEVSSP